MISSITNTEVFEKATRIQQKKDVRMKGSYLLTRFLAFYLLFNGLLFKGKEQYEYIGDLDDLIEVTLVQLNRTLLEELEKLREMTIQCLEMSSQILGKGAFRREIDESKPINMNIFETTLYFMTLIIDKEIPHEKISKGLKRVINSKKYLECIGNSRDNVIKVNGRFNLMKQLFEEICND